MFPGTKPYRGYCPVVILPCSPRLPLTTYVTKAGHGLPGAGRLTSRWPRVLERRSSNRNLFGLLTSRALRGRAGSFRLLRWIGALRSIGGIPGRVAIFLRSGLVFL